MRDIFLKVKKYILRKKVKRYEKELVELRKELEILSMKFIRNGCIDKTTDIYNYYLCELLRRELFVYRWKS